MCFLTLSDGASQMQGVVFPEAYKRFSLELRKGAAVFSGTIGDEDGEPILVVTHVAAQNAKEAG
ncbi:DNA polymerase III DnaE [compost metagenome]